MQPPVPANEERKESGLVLDEPPFTDSGYGSHAGTNLAAKVQNVQAELSRLDSSLTAQEVDQSHKLENEHREYELCDGGQSVYSEGSVVPAATKESYIELLADDLAKKICRDLRNAEDLEMIYNFLPRMLQEFALSFGGYHATQVHRDIMVFVHRYRRYVQHQASRKCVLTMSISTGK